MPKWNRPTLRGRSPSTCLPTATSASPSRPAGDLDPELEVVDPYGTSYPIDSAGSGEAEVAALTGGPGQYQVRVGGYEGSVGSFEIVAAPLNTAGLDEGASEHCHHTGGVRCRGRARRSPQFRRRVGRPGECAQHPGHRPRWVADRWGFARRGGARHRHPRWRGPRLLPASSSVPPNQTPTSSQRSDASSRRTSSRTSPSRLRRPRHSMST